MGWLDVVKAAVTKAVSTAVTAVKNVATAIVSSVSKSVTTASNAVKNVVNTVVTTATSAVSKVTTSTAAVKNTATETAKKAISEATKITLATAEPAVKEAKIVVEEAPPKEDTPFIKSLKRFVGYAGEGRFMDAAKESITLMGASIFPEDVKILAGVIPITPVPAGISPEVLAKLGVKVSVWGQIAQVLKNLAASAKANPMITIFAATEIPQITIMSIFAFKWLAEQKGETLSGASISLNNLYKAWESGGYEFRDAVKAGNYGNAAKVLSSMISVTMEYENKLKEKKEVIEKAGEMDLRNSILDLMKTANKKMEGEIEPQVKQIQTELQEIMNVRVREIIDGDTVRVRWEEGDITLDVRLVGINAPETGEVGKKESKDWLSKEIWGSDVILKVDPARKRDVYDRVLGVIVKAGEDINLKSVKEGWSFAYIREPNKYVDADEYLSAERKAKELNKGIWALIERTGIIGVSSSPTHAKIFLDGKDTGLTTAETIKGIPVGKHKVRLELEGYEPYEEEIVVEEDRKREVYKKLEKEKIIPAVPVEEVPEEEVAPPIVEAPTGFPAKWVYLDEPVAVEAIPEVFTAAQEWAVQECLNKVWALMKGTEVMSEEERVNLFSGFALHSDEQKEVLNLLFQDITYLEKGRRQMSDAEFNALKKKYRG